MKKPFYITTTLPYVNAEAHMGHALEFIRADAIARYKHLNGHEVLFNTGADEHGVKIYNKAKEEGKEPQEFVDHYAGKLKELGSLLGLKESDPEHGFTSNFIRTTDERHIAAAIAFWKKCDELGFIYKKKYKGLYCIGDEAFVTEKDLVNGECPNHPGQKPIEIEEENYFFKYSAFEKDLLDLYKKQKDFVIPEVRLNEIRSFVSRGLEDFSISRLKSKMPWGVPVPGDDDHVMYVWFDALVSYISTLGWPTNEKSFKKWWIDTDGVVQYCGKDNLQYQAARWQAMLMSVGLLPSKEIVINGFILGAGGIKMSKSVGNVVNPLDIINEYGTDALRYYLLREVSAFEDSSFTLEHFKEAYNANLANGIGNLTSRIMKMAESNLDEPVQISEWEDMSEYFSYLETFDLKKAADYVWMKISELDETIQAKQPFKLIKTDKEAGKKLISELVVKLYSIARMLNPLLPETSAKIKKAIKENKMPSEPLFLRKE